ncbi:hypothetical protein CSE45_0632 [Citreicella sp. SE45]|nr:hypothetical protein CSE45_0632 [Citreicella sp. SE45]
MCDGAHAVAPPRRRRRPRRGTCANRPRPRPARRSQPCNRCFDTR